MVLNCTITSYDDNDENMDDFFSNLVAFRPQHTVLIGTSAATSLALVLASVGIVWYDEYVNRNATLLSKLNSRFIIVCCLWTGPFAVDAVRFLTGIRMPSALCYSQVRTTYV